MQAEETAEVWCQISFNILPFSVFSTRKSSSKDSLYRFNVTLLKKYLRIRRVTIPPVFISYSSALPLKPRICSICLSVSSFPLTVQGPPLTPNPNTLCLTFSLPPKLWHVHANTCNETSPQFMTSCSFLSVLNHRLRLVFC